MSKTISCNSSVKNSAKGSPNIQKAKSVKTSATNQTGTTELTREKTLEQL